MRKAGVLCERRDGRDGRARQARREGIRAARRRRRRHPRRRRRHRLPHHRLDADGQPGDGVRQSAAVAAACCKKGDIINMELAAGYRGYSAQIGSPICVGEPTEMVRKFWDEITLPGYKKIIAEIAPGNACREHARRPAGSSATRACSRARPSATASTSSPTSRTSSPSTSRPSEIDKVLKPGMIIMAEPNPITPTACSASSSATPSS